MFKILTPPLKVYHNLPFCSNQMQQLITMIADDATMNVIIWIPISPSDSASQ